MKKELVKSLSKKCRDIIQPCLEGYDYSKSARSGHVFKKYASDIKLYFFVYIEAGKYDYDLDVRICWSVNESIPKKIITDPRSLDIRSAEIELDSYWVSLGMLSDNNTESYEIKNVSLILSGMNENLGEIESDDLIISALKRVSRDIQLYALPYFSWIIQTKKHRC